MEQQSVRTNEIRRGFSGFISLYEVKKYIKASSAKKIGFVFYNNDAKVDEQSRKIGKIVGKNGNITKEFHTIMESAPTHNRLVIVEKF